MLKEIKKYFKNISIVQFSIFILTGMVLFNFFIYNVIFEFLPSSIFYDREQQVLVTTSDARHYKNEILSSCNAKGHELKSYKISAILAISWEKIKSQLCQLGFTTIFRIGLLNLILILGFQLFFTILIFNLFQVKQSHQKIGLLILLMLPTQYSWFVQPIKDGWLVIANLTSLYLLLKFNEKTNFAKNLLQIVALILFFVITVGIARQQYIYLILIPLVMTTFLSVFIEPFPQRISQFILRIFVKVILLLAMLFPLLSLENGKEEYYETNFGNRALKVNNDFGGSLGSSSNESATNVASDYKVEKSKKVYEMPFINKLKTLIEIRNTYADRYAENYTYIDPVKFRTVSEGISYMPKSMLIGLTTPLNILNIGNADVRSSTPMLQLIAQTEILVFIVLMCITVFLVIGYKSAHVISVLMGIMYFIPPSTIIAFAMPNAGVIVRQRFPFLYISFTLMLIVLFKIYSWKKVRVSAKC